MEQTTKNTLWGIFVIVLVSFMIVSTIYNIGVAKGVKKTQVYIDEWKDMYYEVLEERNTCNDERLDDLRICREKINKCNDDCKELIFKRDEDFKWTIDRIEADCKEAIDIWKENSDGWEDLYNRK